MSEDPEFESADAGSSLTYPMQAGALRKGGHAILKGHPCKIMEISISKTGKHGHAKAAIVGIDIFTNKKYEDMCPTSHNMEVPNVSRQEYALIDCDGDAGTVSVLLESGDTKDDLNLPTDVQGGREELAGDIVEKFEEGKSLLLTVQAAMGMEKIIAVKEVSA